MMCLCLELIDRLLGHRGHIFSVFLLSVRSLPVSNTTMGVGSAHGSSNIFFI